VAQQYEKECLSVSEVEEDDVKKERSDYHT